MHVRFDTVAVLTTFMPFHITPTFPVSDRLVLVASGTYVFHIEVIILENFERASLKRIAVRTQEEG